MARWEPPIDRADGPLAEFAAGLRALYESAGSPSYEALARRTVFPASALSMAASGRVMPSLPVTLAYVRACGGDPSKWELRWRALNALVDPGLDTPPGGLPIPAPVAGAPSPAAGPPATGRSGGPAGRTVPPAHPRSAHPRPAPPRPALDATNVRATRSSFEPAGGPAGEAVTRPDGRRPSSRPAPRATPAAEPPGHAVRAAPRHRVGHARRYRRPAVAGGAAVALAGTALGAWLAVGDSLSHPRQASRASMPMPRAGSSVRPPGAGPVARRGSPAATTTPRAGVGAASPAGPGCPASTAASGTAHAGAGGDGWIEVGGGPTECGGHALATYTTTGTGVVQDTYTWRFRTTRGARCTVRLFIPDTNPSSASARYDVYGAAKRLGGFTVVQAAHKGRWVEEGTWIAFSGVLQVRLTDRADYPGAHHHVTAAAAGA